MRAERLLSILLLLQARGRMTARELATELEVSERTLYRDIEALSAAGVPVYGEPGPGGGFQLVDRYRTSLTGLKEEEVRALFMLSIPAPLVRLGVDEHLRAAFRKLAASLPESRRRDPVDTRRRYLLDAAWWRGEDEPLPHIQVLYDAVWQDRLLLATWRVPVAGEMASLIEPYGLVAKADVWHLVFARAGRVQARRVAQLTAVRDTGERFERPAGFDLEAFWHDWCRENEAAQGRYRVALDVAAGALPELHRRLASRFVAGGADSDDPAAAARVELAFESLEEARDHLLALGGAVVVLEPLALRLSLRDYGRQIVAACGRADVHESVGQSF